MTKIHSPLPDDARKATGEALQGAVVDLIDLSLVGKQAHWNVVGRTFRSIHLQLDELVDAARKHTDVLAERAISIGVNPDGRSTKVAADTKIGQPEPGYLQEDKVIALIVDALGVVVKRFRDRVEATEKPDPVTQDLLIAASQDLEEQHWMFEAMR
ncbi:starvation-inducible DNA-binding protein [Spinactinospora alkalitolerans]|uniref:Starvation-inducible DNA-binding protein n=1 Tax=Spinactinospora alkalitolerans TaxID=687207 RepID=A0A852U5C8_9ACTN|nr:DNA starvation/stationary phase protection protein [Spinactinospora alkalitolerans]NYE49130.1 starvation-inducible DNA-binding protein [Spinactinospora alkalitolerans]